MTVTILEGNCIETLKTLADASVQCVVTSPPYYGLRDYGTAKWVGGTDLNCAHNPQRSDGGAREDRALPLGRGGLYKDICGKCGAIRVDNQIGLEPTPEAYVENLLVVFREVRRVLKDDGTLWLNLGDSYAGSGKGGQSEQKRSENWQPKYANKGKTYGLKPKDLIGIPWMVAFALRLNIYWMGKQGIFRAPFGGLMRWLGGIAVNRSQSTNLVAASAQALRESPGPAQLVVPPEGTRSKVRYWKTGFYYIALEAGVPIILAYMDYEQRRSGLGPVFVPTGDIERDMLAIKAFYAPFKGKNPGQFEASE